MIDQRADDILLRLVAALGVRHLAVVDFPLGARDGHVLAARTRRRLARPLAPLRLPFGLLLCRLPQLAALALAVIAVREVEVARRAQVVLARRARRLRAAGTQRTPLA